MSALLRLYARLLVLGFYIANFLIHQCQVLPSSAKFSRGVKLCTLLDKQPLLSEFHAGALLRMSVVVLDMLADDADELLQSARRGMVKQ